MKTRTRTQRGLRSWIGAGTAAMLLWGGLPAGRSLGAGLLIADGGFGGVLEIEEHDVHVVINNGIAVTHVTQVFRNMENRQVEALFTFPVPKGASMANFSMWINGKEMVGEVLEKQRAREIYDSYKRKRQDPGLLEQVDYKTFEMRIFPINAKASQKVEVTYYQELDVDHDRATYVYPLATVTRSDVDSRTSGKFAIDVEIKSAIPIVSVDSPSHGDAFVVAKHAEDYSQTSLETSGGSLARDVVVSYDLSRPRTGIDVITSRTDGDGYFCLTLTVGEDLATLEQGMDYVFVLDVSGSMAQENKLLISKDSVDAFLGELSSDDRFDVITFNVRPDTLFSALQPGTPEMKDRARAYLSSQAARGGTVLAPAIMTAYKYGDPDRPLNVMILSDGMTEQKERQELLRLIQARPKHARVFCVGIGNEVNRALLEQLADDSGGLAAFLSQGDDFGRQAKAFRRKLMRPVATDLQLEFGGLRVYDVEPPVMPNLYHGSPVRVYGRYAGDGAAQVTLKGNVRGVALKQSCELPFPARDADNPEIERMWAWRRVDRLLKQADRAGSRDAVIDDIVALGETYSIVSEYTSFLVLENDAEFQRWKIERRGAKRLDRDRDAQARHRARLEELRGKSVAGIGPVEAQKPPARQESPPMQVASAPTPSIPVTTPAGRRPAGFDLNMGTGPVGPLFMGLLLWLRNRARARTRTAE